MVTARQAGGHRHRVQGEAGLVEYCCKGGEVADEQLQQAGVVGHLPGGAACEALAGGHVRHWQEEGIHTGCDIF